MSRGTRTRVATHGSTIVSDATCPACGAHRVREATLRQIVERSCGLCGHRWRPHGEPAHCFRGADGALRCDGCLMPLPRHVAGCQFDTPEV